jgi:hypothetical protein
MANTVPFVKQGVLLSHGEARQACVSRPAAAPLVLLFTQPAASHTAMATLNLLPVCCSPCLVIGPAALLGLEQASGAVEWSGGGKEQAERVRFIYPLPWPVRAA